jgi:hypothetical protein
MPHPRRVAILAALTVTLTLAGCAGDYLRRDRSGGDRQRHDIPSENRDRHDRTPTDRDHHDDPRTQ